MEGLLAVVENVGRFVILLGGALSVVFLAYAGILWMASVGDPQKVAQARGALVGVLVGLVIVGIAFVVPGVISELIIEPAGGARIQAGVSSHDCDGLLQQQLVVQRNANSAKRMNDVINHIQAKYEDCDPDVWDPEAAADSVPLAKRCTGIPIPRVVSNVKVGGIRVPAGLIEETTSGRYRVYKDSKRDSGNNVLVLWRTKPTDQAVCWVYFDVFGTWRSSY